MKQTSKKLNKILLIGALCFATLSLLSCKVNKNVAGDIMEYDKIEYLGHGSLKLLLKDGKICYIDPFAEMTTEKVAT